MIKRIWAITLFPDFFRPMLECGIIGAVFRGERDVAFTFHSVQLADFSPKNFKGVDDSPYGGGPGMVMRADVLKRALLEGVVAAGGYGDDYRSKLWVINMSPRGRLWDNLYSQEFAAKILSHENVKDLVFICGRYEGIDERFLQQFVDLEISLGNFILTGGELAVMSILDSALRFIPGVLGNNQSTTSESFQGGGELEHPIYTRPKEFEGVKVPKVLLSGHHKEIEIYRQKERLRVTALYRPDILGENR